MDTNLRIAVCGGVDAGKSSLIGVLTHNILDDGDGYARSLITRYKHEIESRHTSAISYNYIRYPGREIIIIDLAGHEEYFKTTAYGVNAHNIDYAIFVVGANLSLNETMRQHIILLVWLNIPFIIIISKIDICSESIFKENRKRFRAFISGLVPNKRFTLIKDERFDEFFANCGNPEYFNSIMPVISVSAKTGENIDNIHNIFKLLSHRNSGLADTHIPKSLKSGVSILSYIEHVYSVKGTGIVITGYLSKSCSNISVGQQLFVGPFGVDRVQFVPVVVRGLHDNFRNSVKTTTAGQGFSANIRFVGDKLPKNRFRKGLIVTSDTSIINKVSKRFIAKVKIIDSKSAINVGCTHVIHYRSIRQSARIVEIISTENENISGPDVGKDCKSTILFEFLQRPEYIEEGVTIFCRDGRTQGVGEIISIA
jgi:elongation factor 1-alpha